MRYEEYISMNLDDKFKYFMETRFPTNRTPSYWVNWDKVKENISQYEIMLNTMNYLVGKDDIENRATELLNKQPDLIKVIPLLMACRDDNLNVLKYDEQFNMSNESLDFNKPNGDIDKYIEFMKESGLLSFLSTHVTRSLVDYAYGVEVGLDSNGRKNRSGTENENILERNLKLLINHNPTCEYMTQATADSIKSKWDVVVPEALESGRKGGRRYDGAVFNKKTGKLTVIETNFYGGGGSKLKAVAGEFSEMYGHFLRTAENVDFAWISDGPGWDTAKNPMREAFDVIPNIINLNMVSEGYLSDIVK
ncbi:Type-2 restriction enzyme DpnII [Apilactobacillus kunkeei]|nr:Type-2 restriction enzyme DpnII [Apilactobacillus kunkeei]CAI2555128.1 Type-2 restriction enzyme DpnII [Apilactobacillus kunkeei]CAI2555250.1 Type-2 restriction enzyme DpnII [Apilactobacillus kunkeei]CAI2555449.1 Type-2 restriction enzyme DpnII [Apilactobacillus kunkeei]CAI2555536.1 Type-2 restriction enzyme DpnII [Apilactobacillus kunkeei]